MGDVFLFQQEDKLLHPFIEPGDRLVKPDLEMAEFLRHERAGDADFQPAVRQPVQHADLSRQLQRIIEHRQHRAGDDPRLLADLRGGAQEHDGVGAVTAIGMKIMFDRPDMGVTVFVRQSDQLQTFIEILARGFFFRLHARKKLHPEFHLYPPAWTAKLPRKTGLTVPRTVRGGKPRAARPNAASGHSGSPALLRKADFPTALRSIFISISG